MTYIGKLPGYVYDEEKRKYFKITADHQPAGGNYSRGVAQQQQRETKRRKQDHQRRQHVQAQTVRRPNVLLDALTTNIALHREHGNRTTARFLTDRDAALVQDLAPHLRPATFERDALGGYNNLEITQLAHCPDVQQAVYSLRHDHGLAYTLHTMPARHLEHDDAYNMYNIPSDAMTEPFAAFSCSVSSISTAEVGGDVLVVACTQRKLNPGNVFCGRLSPKTLSSKGMKPPYELTSSCYASISAPPLPHAATSLWCTSLVPGPYPTAFAIAGTLGVWTLDINCHPISRLSITGSNYSAPDDDETMAVDWLDANTVAAGIKSIYLWDQRSGGASQRFRCRGRVTGISNPERGLLSPDEGRSGGQTLLVSTNHTINLFDVRYISKTEPLLSWAHQHEGPQIQWASSGQGLVAATDRDQYVHVYSTRTGGEVKRLERKPATWREALRNLQWFEDGSGRVGLRAQHQGKFVEWTGRGEDWVSEMFDGANGALNRGWVG